MKKNFRKNNKRGSPRLRQIDKSNRGLERGFTLIETIIYLGLYGLVIGGVVVAAYAMFESTGRNQSKAMLEEEGTYLIGKIDWALTGATAASVSGTRQQLYVNRDGISATDNPLTFDGSGGMLRLSRGTAAAQTLNNTNVTITNPIFVHATSSGDGVTPESIKATFTLTIMTPNGFQLSEDFSVMKYLRK